MYVISNIRESRESTELELVVNMKTAEFNALNDVLLLTADKTLWKHLLTVVKNEMGKAQDTLKSVQALKPKRARP